MSANKLSASRARQILSAATKTRVLVVGDVMLDQFIWGGVSRISPEAPVPVVDFSRESFMPGGAANVARNLVSLEIPAELFGAIGNDDAAKKLLKLLGEQNIGCAGLVKNSARHTSIKTRIVAHQQQVVRIDRETRGALDEKTTAKLLAEFKTKLAKADAVIVGDYGKGVVTQLLLNEIKSLCHARGVWLSLDPKPVHHLNLSNLSLITPNRKEAFELADLPDETKNARPLADKNLMLVWRAEDFTRPAQPMFCSARIFCSLRPASSLPIAPNSSVGVARETRLRATFAAPPGMKLSRLNSTTGTGASGEMRDTPPQMNWSSITSPTTSTRVLVAAARICRAREADNFCALIFLTTDGHR